MEETGPNSVLGQEQERNQQIITELKLQILNSKKFLKRCGYIVWSEEEFKKRAFEIKVYVLFIILCAMGVGFSFAMIFLP